MATYFSASEKIGSDTFLDIYLDTQITLMAMRATDRRPFWIGVVAVVVLAASAFGLASLAWHYLPKFLPKDSSTAVTALATFLGSALTLVLTKNWDRRREIEQEHRKQKTPIYEDFIAFLFKLLMTSKTGGRLSEKEMAQFMINFTQRLTIWGSNDVIQKFGEFRQMDQSDPRKMIAAVEDILFCIRTDLGHPSGLKRDQLSRLYINDLDKLPPVPRKEA